MDYNELIRDLKLFLILGKEDLHEASILLQKAAYAVEDLYSAAKAMHTWIFLHTGDEQAAYDECRLSDEMNAALGYGGKIELEANSGDVR